MLCDNMSAVMAFNKGRCQNHALLRLTRKLAAFALSHNICFRVRYVESARNVADGPTRPDKLAQKAGIEGGESDLRIFVQTAGKESWWAAERKSQC